MDTDPSVMDRIGLVPAGEQCDMLAVPGETLRMDTGAGQASEIHVVNTAKGPAQQG